MRAHRVTQGRGALHRLIFFLSLLVSSSSASAVAPTVWVTFLSGNVLGNRTCSHTSVEACLATYFGDYDRSNVVITYNTSGQNGTLSGYLVWPSNGTQFHISGGYWDGTATCPAGSSLLSDGTCTSPCNTTDTLSGAIPADQNPALICSNSCEFEVQQASNTWTASTDLGTIPAGSNVIVGSWIGTGNSCSASSVTPQNPTNNTCPTGEVNIGFGCMTYADNFAAVNAANALGTALQDPYGTPAAASAVTGTTTNASGVQSTITLDMAPLTTELTIIKNRLGSIHQDLGADQPIYNPVDAPVQANNTAANFSQDYQALADGVLSAHDTDEASLLGWFSVDLPSNSCSPWVGTVHGFSFSFNWCPYTEMLRSLIGWLFALFGAWRIWNIIFGARS